jgi:hypothetical protein
MSWFTFGCASRTDRPAAGCLAAPSHRRFRPLLEILEDRTVPSGTPLDLTAPAAEGMIDGVIFRQTAAQPTGTGVIRSFLRLQAANANSTIEQGYNTDARPLQFDEKTSATFTHSLQLGDAAEVVIDGTPYIEFLLDINQQSSQSTLSLDELRFYVADTPNLRGYDAATKQLGGVTAVYDQTAGGEYWVKLDAGLNSGSGSGDLLVYVPTQLFASGTANPYLYVYSKFGVHLAANGGFEEWATRLSGAGGAASVSGTVYLDVNQDGQLNEGDSGIAGVVVTLAGYDDRGRFVTFSVTTGADGTYSFTGLRAGTYSLIETQPERYHDGEETIGTVNGATRGYLADSGDRFDGILLRAGDLGLNYNFAELLFPDA